MSTSDRQPTSHSFTSQGLKLHYLDWGNPDAPTLILQHGMHDHARSWDWIARALCDQWHIVAPDLRGHGDSEWSPDGAYHTAYYLLDMAKLIEQLDKPTISFVAHSLGGNPATRYAALYPDRVENLVLVDAMGPTAPTIDNWNRQGIVNRTRDWLEKNIALSGRDPRRFDTIEEAVARMRKAHSYLSAEQALHLTTHGVREQDGQYRWKYDPLAGNFNPEDFAVHLSEYWRDITAPTLICWGPNSWTTDPAKDGSAAQFRNSQTQTFEQSGHWVHHDQPDDFIAAVKQFLTRT